jgi:CPA2 family monovalent cation:H+ antiporter-2
MLTVRAVRTLSPDVVLIVRARYRKEADALVALGATMAVAEEFEASLEVLTQLLARLQVPDKAVEVLLDQFRRPSSGSRPMRPVGRLEELSAELVDVPVSAHRLDEGAWAGGRSLADLDLRAQTGALIIALRRGDQNIPSPPPDMRLQTGDLLYLTGSGADLTRARKRISYGE